MDRNTKSRTRRIVTTAALGMALLSLVPLAAQAWGRSGRNPSPERAVEHMTEKLNLSAEQQDEVRTILEESFAKRREAREAHRAEMELLRSETENRLAGVLSTEQMDELGELRENRRGRHGDCDRRHLHRHGKEALED